MFTAKIEFGKIAKSVASTITSRRPPLRVSRETPSSRQLQKLKIGVNIWSHQLLVDKVIKMSSRPELKVRLSRNRHSNATRSNFL
jgi:hypothetical protein